MKRLLDMLALAMIPAFGATLIFIFWTIEVRGSWGKEDNPFILGIEMIIGFGILILGIWKIVRELRTR